MRIFPRVEVPLAHNENGVENFDHFFEVPLAQGVKKTETETKTGVENFDHLFTC